MFLEREDSIMSINGIMDIAAQLFFMTGFAFCLFCAAIPLGVGKMKNKDEREKEDGEQLEWLKKHAKRCKRNRA